MTKIPENKVHVLIVDDDPAIVKLIGTTLNRRLGDEIHVTTTVEPAHAWALATEGTVDICVSDMDMPTINGFKLLKRLKETNPLTQVIFLTAHPTIEAVKSAFSMSVNDFLAKPVNLDEVCKSVQFMADRVQRLQRDLISPTA